jgi:hypothetical protein
MSAPSAAGMRRGAQGGREDVLDGSPQEQLGLLAAQGVSVWLEGADREQIRGGSLAARSGLRTARHCAPGLRTPGGPSRNSSPWASTWPMCDERWRRPPPREWTRHGADWSPPCNPSADPGGAGRGGAALRGLQRICVF